MNTPLSSWGHLGYPVSIVTSVTELSSIKRLQKLALDQISKAHEGARLTSYNQAENASGMMNPSDTNEKAYYRTAYWLAVASRISGDRSLLLAAISNDGKGRALGITPGSSFLTGSAEKITRETGEKIAAVASARGDKQTAAIAKLLGVSASMTAAAITRAYDAGTRGYVSEKWEQVGRIAASAGSAADKGLQKAEEVADFAGKPKPIWFWPVVGLGGFVLVALVLGIGLGASPAGIAARAAKVATSRTNRRRRGR
jgi:hypothetical protein